jgi:peptide/nickel transport system substrate-binding protein
MKIRGAMKIMSNHFRSDHVGARLHRRILSFGVVVVAASLLALVGPGAAGAGNVANATGAIKKGGILRVGEVEYGWPTLDPGASTVLTTSNDWLAAIYDQLLRAGNPTPSGTPITPDLIQSWAYSNHNLTLTLHVRPGVKFTDGTPFDAAAVQWSIKRDLVPGGCTCQPELTDITSVTTSGKYNVILGLTSPDGFLLNELATTYVTYVPSPTAVQSEGASFATNPVGAGPFKVVSDEVNASLDLVRNPHYWDAPQPYLNGIDFTYLTSDTAGLADVESGSLDIETGPNSILPSTVQQAKGAGNVRVVLTQSPTWYHFDFNTTVPPFNNILAREAVEYATNTAAIAKSLSGNLWTPTQILDAPGATPFPGVKLKGAITYNLAKAKALVQQLGGLSFAALTVISTSPIDAALYSELQNEWSQAGIQTTLTNTPTAGAFVGILFGAKWPFLFGQWGSYPLLGTSWQQVYTCKAEFNLGYCDNTVNNLVTDAGLTTNSKEQVKLFTQAAEQLEVTDRDAFPLFYVPWPRIETFNVEGIPTNTDMWLNAAWLK